MGRYKYSREHVVPIYDCDPFLRARPSSLLRYIQTVAGEHLDTIGLTHKRLYDEGFVFVVAGTAMKVFRSPRADEGLVIHTAPLAGGGAHMLRETVITSPKGEPLVECQTNWALINAKTGRLMRAFDFPYELPMLEGEWAPFFDPRRIRVHPVCEGRAERAVRLSDLDQNMHMNNTVYADLITDCFGDEYLGSDGVDSILIRYHLQARLGDVITLEYGSSGGLYTVGARCGDRHCFEGSFSLKPLETV